MYGYISRKKALLPDIGEMERRQLVQNSGQQLWLIHVDLSPAVCKAWVICLLFPAFSFCKTYT